MKSATCGANLGTRGTCPRGRVPSRYLLARRKNNFYANAHRFPMCTVSRTFLDLFPERRCYAAKNITKREPLTLEAPRYLRRLENT